MKPAYAGRNSRKIEIEKQTQGAAVQLQHLSDVGEHRVSNANLYLTSRQLPLRGRLLMQITIIAYFIDLPASNDSAEFHFLRFRVSII